MTRTRSQLRKIDDNLRSNKEPKPSTNRKNNSQVATNKKVKEENDSSIMPKATNDEQTVAYSPLYIFDGTTYETYDDMVQAKRQRNRDMLVNSGILTAAAELKKEIGTSVATKRGIRPDSKKRKGETNELSVRRRSNRLAGIESDGIFVKEESGGRITVSATQDGLLSASNQLTDKAQVAQKQSSYYNGRVNDGSDLTLMDAVQLTGPKWISESTVTLAQRFVKEIYCTDECEQRMGSTQSSLSHLVKALSVDDPRNAAKVVPERVYSVTFHPSPNKIIAVAGDKEGYVGFWDVDSRIDTDTNGVHLFKPHNRPVSNVEWNRSGQKLMSVSYDGSVRLLDVDKELFSEVFATYDESSDYQSKLGYGLHHGYNDWVQYATFDHRFESCLFVTTSLGNVMHIDWRQKSLITFNKNLSEKKINTVSLHPNGVILASAGLDCTTRLWDIRKFQISSARNVPIAIYHATKSINSAFFSPSGKSLLCTTMANSLDVICDAHLNADSTVKPTNRIRHDNMTGRWLSTFMARWHPECTQEELFVVGSMQQPRTLEVFDATSGKLLRGIQGSALTAVLSRCCFHPSTDRLIMAGGNSSGRLVIAR